jgi:hypothetical protein
MAKRKKKGDVPADEKTLFPPDKLPSGASRPAPALPRWLFETARGEPRVACAVCN